MNNLIKFVNINLPVKSFCNWLLYFSKSKFNIKLGNIHNGYYYKLIKLISELSILRFKCKKKLINKKVLSKSLISKSNKKIYKQKGLGKARVRSLKSSNAKGGGVIFGPILGFKKIFNKKNFKYLNITFKLIMKRTDMCFLIIPFFNCSFIDYKIFLSNQIRNSNIYKDIILI